MTFPWWVAFLPRSLRLFEAQPEEALSPEALNALNNLPRGLVLKAVNDAVDELGNLRFQSECGISTDKFLEALNFYLEHTFVEYSDKLYLHKKGVCIWSSLTSFWHRSADFRWPWTATAS